MLIRSVTEFRVWELEESKYFLTQVAQYLSNYFPLASVILINSHYSLILFIPIFMATFQTFFVNNRRLDVFVNTIAGKIGHQL